MFIRPLLVVFDRMNMQPTLHTGMTETAELGAGQLVLAGLGRFEPRQDRSAGHGVLFKALVGNEETMNDIV